MIHSWSAVTFRSQSSQFTEHPPVLYWRCCGQFALARDIPCILGCFRYEHSLYFFHWGHTLVSGIACVFPHCSHALTKYQECQSMLSIAWYCRAHFKTDIANSWWSKEERFCLAPFWCYMWRRKLHMGQSPLARNQLGSRPCQCCHSFQIMLACCIKVQQCIYPYRLQWLLRLTQVVIEVSVF